MELFGIVAISACVLGTAYLVYGRVLARLFVLDPARETPAGALQDGKDYEPADPRYLLGQHFSAIAAAGPIVGPILAGVMFGWLPALIWILVGSVLIGGVHDFASLVASIRHKARSIAEVVREHMSRRSYVLFLSFIFIALIYIIVAFTDITARAFVGTQNLEDGVQVAGGGIATASLLYLVIPVLLGLALRFTKVPLGIATLIALPLVALSIWFGQSAPLTFDGIGPLDAHGVWVILILGYCLLAAAAPVWLVLQPRGHLGGYFLYAAIGIGFLGVIFSGKGIQYPAFTSWQNVRGETLMPFLFITIACGACSGFHSLIASGTTSKQLRRETDAKPVAYGSMLLEAFVAILALTTVMTLAPTSDLAKSANPNLIYASGIGGYLSITGLPVALAVSFALMAFTTFVYDTLDVCTRLGRYIVQELTGLKGAAGMWLGTGLTAGLPVFFVLTSDEKTPAWRTYWGLFGASNQLLAALTFVGLTVWLWRTKRAAWVWPVIGLPCLWMVTMSVWALGEMVRQGFAATQRTPVPYVGAVLLALAALMLLEAIRSILRPPVSRPPLDAQPTPA
jgi:carbon starvation protein